MNSIWSERRIVFACTSAAAVLTASSNFAATSKESNVATNERSWSSAAPPAQRSCQGDSGGLMLPVGFCATVFADNIGHARHMAVADDSTLYVNTWSGAYYPDTPLPDGGFVVALKDSNGKGKANVIERFGETMTSGGHGGTGIALYKNAIYLESNDKILRYPLRAGKVVPDAPGDIIVSDLPLTGDHPMHPFVITPSGELFVDVASSTNACQAENRVPRSKGLQPCVEKETRAGIWRYDANRTGQVFSSKERYASGIRNGQGLAVDAQGLVFSTQHGRDQLRENWPELYSNERGYESPAEEIVLLTKSGVYGWPECYYDTVAKRLVLAPEYGGDGGNKVGVCARRPAPVAVFPAHWGPNDLKFYRVTQGHSVFPNAYSAGAFIAFHGSWNRAPGPQGGYNVVFRPFKDGKAFGKFVIFADGFAGPMKEPGRAAFRPSGLAIAPDGALFISDDVHGRIWRVTYNGGNANAPIASAHSDRSRPSSSDLAAPREGIYSNADKAMNLPVPAGSSPEMVELGSPNLSRASHRSDMRRLSWFGWDGLAGRCRPYVREVALEQWKSVGYRRDNQKRGIEAKGTWWGYAPYGRCAAFRPRY